MVSMPKKLCVVSALLAGLTVATFAGPAEVSVLFTNIVATSGTTNVFVVGNIPQLGDWDPTRSVKLVSSSGTWRASIGITEGTGFEYKFIRRATSPHPVMS